MANAQATALARRYRLEINTGTEAAPNWELFPGIVEFKPNNEPTLEDDNDFDGEGALAVTKTAQQWTLEVKFSYKIVNATGQVNAVHAYVEEKSESFPPESVVHLRYYDRGGVIPGREGFAEVQWEPEGGEVTDLDQVSATFTASSASPQLVTITNPANANPVSQVTSLSPATGTAAGGQLIMVSGVNFVSGAGVPASAVHFGAVASTDFEVINTTTIAAIAPAQAAGTVNVRVTTTAGQSATAAANQYIYT